jgi:hypothetical protein
MLRPFRQVQVVPVPKNCAGEPKLEIESIDRFQSMHELARLGLNDLLQKLSRKLTALITISRDELRLSVGRDPLSLFPLCEKVAGTEVPRRVRGVLSAHAANVR